MTVLANSPNYADRSAFHYSRRGVTVEIEGSDALLTYQSHGQRITRRLPPDGPENGCGEVTEKDIGLHFYYHRGISSWVISHFFPQHLEASTETEWFEDTLIVPRQGTIELKKGYFPARPGSLWPHVVELGMGIIGAAVGIWISVLYIVGSSRGTSASAIAVAMGVSLAVITLVELVVYFVSPGRRAERALLKLAS